ncbi:hypothetical protein [uncultured Muribaculum sp.]|uniref:hypothetical protein n=1 Tax=uncultured Muribaculum sp. TaxID=1918613 RepID=UPI0025F0D517|nr:hypothetical protein [uncultured Muribaculum sp.]
MKKRDLLLSAGIISAFTMQAQSPFTGSTAPAEGSADYYLYQVESGKWLQSNQRVPGQWTTHAQLDKNGFDVEVIAIEGGFQLNPKFGRNRSINAGADRFYMDTDRKVSVWGLEPVTVDGISNAYNIKALSAEELGEPYLIGEADGVLSDAPVNTTWQLVSRQDRIEYMKSAVAAGEVDATWLIPGQDMGRNDPRLDQWTLEYISNGSNAGLDGVQHNSVREVWHNATNYTYYIVLSGLPNGTYKMNVQGYYRDTEVESLDLHDRMANGTEVQRAEYFAGTATKKLMPISKDAATAQGEGYSYNVEEAGVWVPNSLNDASLAFLAGKYTNDWVETVVTDGRLILGIIKREADFRDWLVFDNFQLMYVSAETPDPDVTEIKTQLSGLIDEAEKLPATSALVAAIANAKELVASTNVTDIRLAIFNMIKYINGVSSAKSIIEDFNATKAITDRAGVNSDKAVEMFNNAITRDEFVAALRELRYQRRLAVAEKQADVFAGNPVAAGQFYLYNLGRQQFLCGGADWGAHAALGMPGTLLTLEEESAADMLYHIETGLYNGDNNHYLNSRGYMDAGKGGPWKFIPVEGKENVYNIVQGDWPDAYMVWDPYANTDGGNGNETTVSTECRSPKFEDAKDNLIAQWKLVSKADRDALMEKASLENPVDVTHKIACPGFNQRDNLSAWTLTNGSVWGRGDNHNDFTLESWNSDSFDASQMIEGLPTGVYTLWATGFYRDGRHNTTDAAIGQPDLEQISNAYIYAGAEGETYLPNILSESGKAPGEGNTVTNKDGVTYHFPENCDQAANFFRAGLYKTHFTTSKGDEDLVIGAGKEQKGNPEDWVVVDNFRLTYYGADTTPEAVEKMLNETSSIEDITDAPSMKVEDNRIFNLQGIEVVNPTAPGIYIRNGKKFMVK